MLALLLRRIVLRPSGAALALGLVAAGCGGSPESAPEDEPRPNVLLISLDTTRADHLRAYGHSEIETPNIDRLAAEGALFENCAAPVPLTVPSHASLMTGTLPIVHGVRDNGQFSLGDASLTLAEILSEGGYATAAHVAVFVLNRASGLHQGFATYVDTTTATAADDPGAEAPLSRRSTNELRADVVTDAAIETLRGLASREFFLFVHYFDPHSPYEPPAEFRQRYDRPERDERIGNYLGEIAFVDQQVGRLLDELAALDLADDTIVVLTADHGEAFGEHDEIGHSYFVYDTTMHVPLIVRYPRRVTAGLRVERQVRNVDVVPTVLELAGFSRLTDIQGTSLMPYLDDPTADLGLVAYVETLAPFLDYRYSPLRGLRDGQWKYILAPRPELFDVVADPGELQNLHDARPDVAERMKGALADLVRANPPLATADAQAPDAEEVARLQALGYGGGAEDLSDLVDLEPHGPDPKDRIQQMTLASTALRVFFDRNYPTAERMYATLLETDPDNLLFLMKHGDSLLALNRLPEAEARFTRLLELDADHVEAHRRLGRSHASRGEWDVAAGHFREVARVLEHDARAYLECGQALLLSGQLDDASAAVERAHELDPEDLGAVGLLSHVRIRQGRFESAIELLEAELARRSDVLPVLQQLAWLRASCPEDALRDGARALELAEAARALEPPANAVTRLVTAAALAELGRFEEAQAAALDAQALAGEPATPLAQRAASLVTLFRSREPLRTSEPL